MNNKMLTIQDLIDFCKSNKMYSFSSNGISENQIVVQSIQDFSDVEFEEYDNKLFAYVKVCHTLLNRNGSYCSEESMKEAMPSLKYAPFLGFIHQLDNGEWDFHSHDGHIETDEEGNENWIYDEKQIGTFTADEPYLKYDAEMDKTYVIAKVAIPLQYSMAADIIKKNKGTVVSCELAIDEMTYNAKESYLELTKYSFMGVTALGREKNGKKVGEGMLGSKLSLQDFSKENNSFFNINFNNQLEEISSKLTCLLSHFDDTNNENYGKEEIEVEDTKKKNIDDDVIITDEENEDEELQTTNEVDDEPSVIDETEGSEDDTTDSFEEEEVVESEDNSIVEEEACGGKKKKKCEVEETNACGKKKKKCSIENEDGTVNEFEISLDDTIYALTDLVNATYAESDNTYYGCTVFESGYLVMHDYWSGRHYKQTYSKDGDSFGLTGDRIEVYATYATQEELNALDDMRNNYSSICNELKKYHDAEEYAEKMKVFDEEDYSSFIETEEFKSLMEKEFVMSHTKEELHDKCEIAFAKLVRTNKDFSLKTDEKKKNKVNIISDFEADGEPSVYGDYFKSFK